jgi:dTDP-4-amino-4,6-dideoxygalactose transaminase
VGGNFRLDAVQAAMLRVKLPRLAEYTAQRQSHFAEYNRALSGREGVVVPATHPDRTHIANQYTLRVRRGGRDALRRFLQERGIASEIYYPVPLHAQECFRAFGPHAALPVAEALAGEVVSLPVFPEMTSEERAAVLAAIVGFLEPEGR